MPNGKQKWDELHTFANDCYAKGMTFDEIQDLLIQKCNDEPLAYAVAKKVKAEHYAERSKEGRMIIAVSLILIFAGFIITFSNFYSNQSVTLALYGLTTCGIIGVFWGLYKIIG